MYVWRALAALFVIAVPLLFICSSVTYAFNEMRLYSYGFDKYDISRRTGISDEGLMDSARTIRGYFNSPSSPLVLRAEVHGEERELFTERELIHMADVKRLLWGVYGLGAGAMAYLLAYVAVSLWRRGQERWGEAGTAGFVGQRSYGGVRCWSGAGFTGGVRQSVLAVPPSEFRQRLLATGPQKALPGDDVPPRLLAGRHPVRGNIGLIPVRSLGRGMLDGPA